MKCFELNRDYDRDDQLQPALLSWLGLFLIL